MSFISHPEVDVMGIKVLGRKRRNGLASFRSVEPEVRSALVAGWTLVAIYEAHREQLGMSYAQFARYAQPQRKALRLVGAQPRTPGELRNRSPAVPPHGPAPAPGAGPPKGRPEDAVPTLDMDGFAAKALNNQELF